jgi:hypothetical protein
VSAQTLVEKLEFCARVAGPAAALLASRDPTAQRIGREMTAELAIWRGQHMPADPELEALMRHATASRHERWKTTEAPKIWGNWHVHALDVDAGLLDPATEAAWLQENVIARIACPTCQRDTKAAIELMLSARPWERGQYFAATVEFHNAVNERAGGKAQLTLDQARQIWST